MGPLGQDTVGYKLETGIQPDRNILRYSGMKVTLRSDIKHVVILQPFYCGVHKISNKCRGLALHVEDGTNLDLND